MKSASDGFISSPSISAAPSRESACGHRSKPVVAVGPRLSRRASLLTLQNATDRCVEFLAGHSPGVVQADDALSSDEDVRGNRIDAVRLVVRVADGDRLVAEKQVVVVAHVEEMTQLALRRRGTAAADDAVQSRR